MCGHGYTLLRLLLCAVQLKPPPGAAIARYPVGHPMGLHPEGQFEPVRHTLAGVS